MGLWRQKSERIARRFRFSLLSSIALIAIIFAAMACASATTATPISTGPVPAATQAAPPRIASPAAANYAAGLTSDNFFPRLEEAMTREGLAFHTKSEMVVKGHVGPATTRGVWTTETWLLPAQGLARAEFRKDPASTADLADRATVISGGGASFIYDGVQADRANLRDCSFVDLPPLMVAFSCEPFPQEVQGEIAPDTEYQGQPAVALIVEERRDNSLASPGEPARYLITSSFYVDGDRFLPLGWVAEVRDDENRLLWTQVASYDSGFVALDSLPADFFDPASIGYVEKDPAAPLDDPDLGLTVYWLGRAFDPPGDLPPLAFSLASGPLGPGQSPGNKADIEYVLAEDQSGAPPQARPTQVRLQLWRLEEWQDFLETPLGRLWWDSPCVASQEASLEGGRAVIFVGHEPERVPPPAPSRPIGPGQEAQTPPPTPTPTSTPEASCATGPSDRFMAHVYLGDTVVSVNTPHCFICVRRGFEPDPYDTLEGMEAVVKGLRPRSPGE